MKQKIPLLISRNVVIFPDCEVNLEIGREISINAINASIKKHNNEIIIVVQKFPNVDNPYSKELYKVGVLSKVKKVKTHKDGSLLISVIGLKRVSLFNLKSESYKNKKNEISKKWTTHYEPLKETNDSFLKNKSLLKNLFSYYDKLFEIKTNEYKKIKKYNKEKNPNVPKIVNKLCDMWPNSDEQAVEIKQSWLEELNLNKRINLILNTNFISEEAKEEINSLIDKKVHKNISKQQKECYLREKIKIIKEELGGEGSKDFEIQKFKTWMENSDAPANIKKKVKEELQKLEFSTSFSNDINSIKTYLDWIISIPWNKFSVDEENIEKIQKSLDSKHSGLKKAKERIIEFIAVQKRTKNKIGTVICLVGPPGVGKTSLALSIAEALNKKYVKFSLGGISDESEIRGHRRTYVASMPGRIIKGLKQTETFNPLFLLDEIDKLSFSHNGDPASALLEVLDPKQNNKFHDNYIEENIDLSKVMFIATANDEENIPDALLDRLEIINLSSYTEKEKINIAKESLINEVFLENGIQKKEMEFTNEALEFIIQKYTRESGVRNLKKMMSSIARKFVKKSETQNLKHELIDVDKVKKYLKQEIYSFTSKDEISIPGVVNGMAYTSCGGDLLQIEINYYEGKGNILLTGNLKETMKESANVALSYIKSNQKQFNLKNINWCDLDINLHVPSGGIPKDGPSAGITITTALLSAFLKKPIPTNVAMTGEITLRGKVLPIGGLKEKIISAVRGGVDTIFYPLECKRHLVDIPKEILEKIKLHPIKHYSEIFKILF